jgi:hypothetical protein
MARKRQLPLVSPVLRNKVVCTSPLVVGNRKREGLEALFKGLSEVGVLCRFQQRFEPQVIAESKVTRQVYCGVPQKYIVINGLALWLPVVPNWAALHAR